MLGFRVMERYYLYLCIMFIVLQWGWLYVGFNSVNYEFNGGFYLIYYYVHLQYVSIYLVDIMYYIIYIYYRIGCLRKKKKLDVLYVGISMYSI